jgi:hypothetical protein
MLKSSSILCEEHNKKLNDDIDSQFITIFQPLSARMKLKRDRRNNKSSSTSGTHVGTKQKVRIKENSIFPITPYFAIENKIIYAKDEKTAINYEKKLFKEGRIGKSEKIQYCYDMPGIVDISFNLINREFRRGMAKIAAGFASLSGIEKEFLDVIDSSNCKVIEKPLVIPFIPCMEMDKLLWLGTDSFYPMHILGLYSDSNVLYCYIELFSTFKYIVILNNNYTRDKVCNRYFFDINTGNEIDEIDYFSYLHSQKNIPSKVIYERFGKQDLFELCNIASENFQIMQAVHTIDFKKLNKYISMQRNLRKIDKFHNNINLKGLFEK